MLPITEFKDVAELIQKFPTEEDCIRHLEYLRWGGNVISPFDKGSKIYKCKGNKYRCKNTSKYFNVRTNTIFQDTRLPLQKWFIAIYLVANNPAIESAQLSKELDITVKTATFLLQRIKHSLQT